MQGYDNNTYGDSFADVYDEWYADVSDVEATVDRLAALAAGAGGAADAAVGADNEAGDVLELGVGTGRLAIPLAARVWPTRVIGIDSSAAMLARLAANQADVESPRQVQAVLGDMAGDQPPGPFRLVFIAFNTFFNLGSAERQRACVAAVAARLGPGGLFVVEADVPEQPTPTGSHVEVRTIATDRVVLSVARYDGGSNRAEGQFVELTESGGVRLRPWSIRYVTPAELDAMATEAGLVLRERWEDFTMQPFTADSGRHVSVYAAGWHDG